VLAGGARFKDIWFTEPAFQLDLGEQGFRGMASKDAVAGHRVQPALFDRAAALKRAKNTGAEAALVSLCPYRKTAKQARRLSEHPWLGRLYCAANYIRWRAALAASNCYPTDGGRFAHKLIATARLTRYIELLRTANRIPDYGVPKWTRSQPEPPPPPESGASVEPAAALPDSNRKANRELLHRR
jgi:hypothetical protein